ncbi:tyrosine-type recombinase/integrase [Winogradskyella sp. A3E31]|uniref:tyrosine-type recombinase/integrase n=1 Tax=Winogradskyella sp. A3E31 TaxID=3349637 RepID=UPI00398B2EEC
MSTFSLLLLAVHDRVHDAPMKLNYSEPKIYTGGVAVNQWSKLSKKERDKALSKPWYVYYAFRHPETHKLVRQPNIKGGANNFYTKKDRLEILKPLKDTLLFILKKGFNPYHHNENLKEEIDELLDLGDFKTPKKRKTTKKIKPEPIEVKTSVKKAFDKALSIKKMMLKDNSYKRYKSRINQFYRWLKENNVKEHLDISQITKAVVIEYLNEVLSKTSARNRNNSRGAISSLFQVMVDNEIIETNFIASINVLKSNPERNKTYKPEMLDKILSRIEDSDPTLLLLIQFISFGFLRPIEVCRLQVKDIDLDDAKVYVRAKNKPVKIKILPEVLINSLPDLTDYDDESYLITPYGFGQDWETSNDNKRDYFSKQFKKVKDEFGLGVDYGLYSFRHTFITKLYRSLRKSKSVFEAKSMLLGITGHTTMDALEKYLRDIDAEMPDDFSEHLN